MKQSARLAYLRQLCCSGLDKELVIREFLRAVKAVIPSNGNGFTGVNAQFVPTDVIFEYYCPELIELGPVILTAYFTAERMKHMAAWFKRNPVLTDVTMYDKDFYNSDLYNLVWRSMDTHHCIQAPVLQNGKPVAMLALNRSRSERPFNAQEQGLCARLTPYVAHALAAPGDTDICYSDNGISGMMILNNQGTILYLCETAKRLLALSGQPVLCLDGSRKPCELLPELVRLCRNLEAIFQGKDAAPPCLYHTNSQGQFVFRAYWLNKQNNEPGGLIGMTVEHREPLVLKILRGMQNLPLSPTQKEVALLLAQGVSTEQIGRRLHVKPTTVKDHICKIYLKLDIHQREELLPKLLAGEN